MCLEKRDQIQVTSLQIYQLWGGHKSKKRACSHLSTFDYIPRQRGKTETWNTISFCPQNSLLAGWCGWEMKGYRILLHWIANLSGSIYNIRYPGTTLYLLGLRHISPAEPQWLFSTCCILWKSNNKGPKHFYKLKPFTGFSIEDLTFSWTLILRSPRTSRRAITWYANRSVSAERTSHFSGRRGMGGMGTEGEAKKLEDGRGGHHRANWEGKTEPGSNGWEEPWMFSWGKRWAGCLLHSKRNSQGLG